MKVAILHYWFLLNGGGENVVDALLEIFPEADVFCLFAEEGSIPKGLPRERLKVSSLSKIPFAKKMNRIMFPLYAGAIGSFDFSGYDLVLSSDSPPTKGVIAPMETVHISYCHTPGRFIWDLAPQFTASLPWYMRGVFANLAARARTSDFVDAQRVTQFIANSEFVKKRISHFYRRDSIVIYPPVNTSSGYIADRTDDYYLVAGRLVGTKRVEIVIEACNKLGRKLLIVGAGREKDRLSAIAGPTIEFTGRVSDAKLWDYYAHCRALLFAAEEDFGIVPLEAQACGRPVIAYGRGGSLETVRVGDHLGLPDTGVFFDRQDAESVMEAIRRFESKEHSFSTREIQKHAKKFDKALFKSRMRDVIDGYCSNDVRVMSVAK